MLIDIIKYLIGAIREVLPKKEPPKKPAPERRCSGCNALMYLHREKRWRCPVCFGALTNKNIATIFIDPSEDDDDLPTWPTSL